MRFPSMRGLRCVERVLGLALAILSALSMAGAEVDRPNVILIMADDLGWGDVGFNGNETVRTPNLDRMAADGIKLNRFYAQAPSCSPTRASCLTGRNGYRFGVIRANNGKLESEEMSIAEVFQSSGYATGHFGKWHLGTLTEKYRDGKRGGTSKGVGMYSPPWANGYEECFATESKVPTWNPTERPESDVRTYWYPRENDESKQGWVPVGTRYWIGPDAWATDNLEGDDSRIIIDRALPFIEDAVSDKKPFFATIWFHAPHTPVVAGPEFTRLYEGLDDYTKHYYGSITAMDTQIGRLREELEKWKASENTLIFFCSDNGPETIDHSETEKAPGSAGPWRGAKRFLFEGGVRVPGIVVWPDRFEPGQTSKLPISTSDYAPTIFAACGVELESPVTPLDGINALDLLEAGAEERNHAIPFRFLDQIALTEDRYKLYSNDLGKSYQLFDLINDPAETRDLSSEMPEKVKGMARQLEEWLASCEASANGADY